MTTPTYITMKKTVHHYYEEHLNIKEFTEHIAKLEDETEGDREMRAKFLWDIILKDNDGVVELEDIDGDGDGDSWGDQDDMADHLNDFAEENQDDWEEFKETELERVKKELADAREHLGGDLLAEIKAREKAEMELEDTKKELEKMKEQMAKMKDSWFRSIIIGEV